MQRHANRLRAEQERHMIKKLQDMVNKFLSSNRNRPVKVSIHSLKNVGSHNGRNAVTDSRPQPGELSFEQ